MIAGAFSKTPSVVEALLKAKAKMEVKHKVRHLQDHRHAPQCASQLYSLVTRVFVDRKDILL